MDFQPDTTQRSIVAEARKHLPRLEKAFPNHRHLDVAVLKPMHFFGSPEEAALALEWAQSSYIVTFRRTVDGRDWEPTHIR